MDPVRYISNGSSGKQGFEIALALSKLGIKTKFILDPLTLYIERLKTKKVVSADEMFIEVKKSLL